MLELLFVTCCIQVAVPLQPAVDPFAILEQVRRFDDGGLWPGFAPARTPIGFFDGSRSYLVGHPQPPAEFAPVVGHPGSVVFEGRFDQFRANTASRINDVWTATFQVDDDSSRPLSSWVGLVVHETFHVFQRENGGGWWNVNEADLFVYPFDDAKLLALRRRETEVLRRALAARAEGEALPWVAAFNEIRHERAQQMPPNALAYERGIERLEGLADYVQYRAVGGQPNLPEAPSGYAAEATRKRCYDVGSACGLLLDGINPTWSASIPAHWVDEVLESAVADTTVRAGQLEPEVLQAIYEAADRDARAVQQSREVEREEFLTQPGWQIVVECADERPMFPQNFDPLNVRVVSAGEILHSRWLKLGNESGEIEVLNHACLTKGPGPHPLFNGVNSLTITGLGVAPTVTESDNELSITVEGIRLHLRGAQLATEGDRLLVSLGR